METTDATQVVQATQDVYNVWSWLLPLLSGTVGALIGTYCGSHFLHWKKEKKIKRVRAMAVKALNIFKEYAQKKKNYAEAENEFNTKLSVSEKRAVVVALHKLGIPFETPTKDTLDVKNMIIRNVLIDKDEIDAMIVQIQQGNCDSLFFTDIESYFASNLRLNAVRNVGKKYVEEVLAKSYIDKEKPNTIINPDNWLKSFTPGEYQTIAVLRERLALNEYFTTTGCVDSEKIKALIQEIEIGLWDNYLFWDYESYSNIRSQSHLATFIQNAMIGQPMMSINAKDTNGKGETNSNTK